MRNKYRVVSRGATDETMVESCPEDTSTSCCGPHVFTSVLLGVLACVLMTGGVFLAFHRWDPLWLIVSGVGVVLVLIGSVLHCCRSQRRHPGGKGCCLPDHLHNHVVLNGGSLTEQLLPLTNARSVSQLSLNMLPGYFPPMVTTYGIEQHSAVVQNINRIIQQGQSTVGSPGKNFILLSLPGNTPQANIQNLVATVYQLDGSVLAETSNSPDAPPVNTDAAPPSPPQSHIPILKNAEVQTCAAWPVPNPAKTTTSATPSTSSATNESNCSPISTQTDDVAIHLIDCSSEPICDIAPNEAPAPEVLVDVSDDTTRVSEPDRTSLIDVPSVSNILEISSILHSVPTSNTDEPPEVLVDISSVDIQTDSATESNLSSSSNNEFSMTNNIVPPTSTETSTQSTDSSSSSSVATCDRLEPLEGVFPIEHSRNSSLSLVDDDDSVGRSSPPPSYEDVALEGETPIGAFGLAYGTL